MIEIIFERSKTFALKNNLSFDEYFNNYLSVENYYISDLYKKDHPSEVSMLYDLMNVEHNFNKLKYRKKFSPSIWVDNIRKFTEHLEVDKNSVLNLNYVFNPTVNVFVTLYKWPSNSLYLDRGMKNKGKYVIFQKNTILNEVFETYLTGWDLLISEIKDLNQPISGNELIDLIGDMEDEIDIIENVINFLARQVVYFNTLNILIP